MEFVKKAIKEIKKDGEFGGEIDPFISSGQPNMEALNELRASLPGKSEETREGIFLLIADIGYAVDPLYEEGGGLLRDRSVLKIMIEEGLSQKGPARNVCLNVLKEAVPGILLNQYGDILTANLKAMPDPTLLVIIAKAKPKQAKEVVDELLESPAWENSNEARIAAAALGNHDIEQDFIRQFQNESDPEKRADFARYLGYIGTEAALKTLAAEMRTDIVIENPEVSIRSLRVFIVAALAYNYPDKQFLWDNAVEEDEDYERIEKFCEKEFGTTWQKDRPPFLWIQGFPSDIPPE